MRLMELIAAGAFTKQDNIDILRGILTRRLDGYEDKDKIINSIIDTVKQDRTTLMIACMQYMPASIAVQVVKDFDGMQSKSNDAIDENYVSPQHMSYQWGPKREKENTLNRFKLEHPEVYKWVISRRDKNRYAKNCSDYLGYYGYLKDDQIQNVKYRIEKGE